MAVMVKVVLSLKVQFIYIVSLKFYEGNSCGFKFTAVDALSCMVCISVESQKQK